MNESRRSSLHVLIEMIMAYPDRKMEIKFRIGEKVEGTHRGQDLSLPDDISNPSHEIEKTIQED